MITDRDLAGAYMTFALAICGSSFFTKWFWTVALADPRSPIPLILDARVHAMFRLIHRGVPSWQAP